MGEDEDLGSSFDSYEGDSENNSRNRRRKRSPSERRRLKNQSDQRLEEAKEAGEATIIRKQSSMDQISEADEELEESRFVKLSNPHSNKRSTKPSGRNTPKHDLDDVRVLHCMRVQEAVAAAQDHVRTHLSISVLNCDTASDTAIIEQSQEESEEFDGGNYLSANKYSVQSSGRHSRGGKYKDSGHKRNQKVLGGQDPTTPPQDKENERMDIENSRSPIPQSSSQRKNQVNQSNNFSISQGELEQIGEHQIS